MPFGTSLALSPDQPTAVATNQITYVLRGENGAASEYAVAGVTYPSEFLLKIRHSTDKSGVRRSVAQMVDTRIDSLNVPATATWGLTLVRPPSAAFTEAYLIQQFSRLGNLMSVASGANLSKFLNLEV
nr:MAG: coat protein [Leviviridae sp.]